jgi:hypothetical protein
MIQFKVENADPAVLAEIAEIEAIINASMADHRHHPLALPDEPEARLHFTYSKFQALWRGYAVRHAQSIKEKSKDEDLRENFQHLKCPLALDVFQHPVNASDSMTYEHMEFKRAAEGMSFPNPRGVMGTPLADGSCVLNRIVWQQSVAFREKWQMELLPLPAELLMSQSRPAVVAAQAVNPRCRVAAIAPLVTGRDLHGPMGANPASNLVNSQSLPGFLHTITAKGLSYAHGLRGAA